MALICDHCLTPVTERDIELGYCPECDEDLIAREPEPDDYDLGDVFHHADGETR